MSKRVFKRYFEWIGDTIYIRIDGRDTTTSLDSLLRWFKEHRYDYIDNSKVVRLEEELHALWGKHNRLLAYLKLEDVVMPQKKLIRKLPQPIVADSKPRKTGKKAS